MTFIALAIGMGESASGQLLIRLIVESNPGVRLVNGVPLILIVGVVVIAIVVELLGGVIFDFDVNTAYRSVFRKLEDMGRLCPSASRWGMFESCSAESSPGFDSCGVEVGIEGR